jgi:tetratricopeptide (TPR) repeat protein
LKSYRAAYLFSLVVLVLIGSSVNGQVIIKQTEPGRKVQRPTSRSRTDEQVLEQRARRFEQRGDYERALSEWLKVLNIAPWNARAIGAIPDALIVLKRYEEAESFLHELIVKSELRTEEPRRSTDPTTKFSLMLNLGAVLLSKGEEEQAWAIWNDALTDENKSPDAVRSLVSTLQRGRRWEDSERIIREYRSESRKPTFMARELAGSLQAQMNFAGATEELLLFSESTPTAWQITNSYMNRFPDDSTVVEKVMKVLERAIRSDRKNGTLLRVYAAYTLKAGLLEESLTATIEADPLTQSGGMLVLKAAQSMLKEGAVDLARRGFEQVLAWGPPANTGLSEQAKLGQGGCYEALGQYAEARAVYASFIDSHPQSSQLEEARFRIADILLTVDRDAAEALTMFKGIWIRGRGEQKITAGVRIGDCHAWMGEYDAAISSWQQVVTLGRNKVTEDAANAYLRIARANLWRDSTDAAMAALDSILEGNTVNSAFNDAILYSSLVDAGGFYRAVRAFADGDYALFRNDNEAAAASFAEAAGMLQYGKLAEWSRFQQALALRHGGQPQAAIAVLDTFIADFPGSVDLDRAEYTQALIRVEDLGDAEGALEQLQKFLIQHPRSMYLEQVRRKARIISGRVS